jgi:hypothetical protein
MPPQHPLFDARGGVPLNILRPDKIGLAAARSGRQRASASWRKPKAPTWRLFTVASSAASFSQGTRASAAERAA